MRYFKSIVSPQNTYLLRNIVLFAYSVSFFLGFCTLRRTSFRTGVSVSANNKPKTRAFAEIADVPLFVL